MPDDYYSLWLKLPPGNRPPDHYTLLELPLFCSDMAKIEAAASRQLDRLDRFSLTSDRTKRGICQRMMNEVARARVVLVSADRPAYDAQLIEQLDPIPDGELDLDSDNLPRAKPLQFTQVSRDAAVVPRRLSKRRLWSRVSALCALVSVSCGIASWVLQTRQIRPQNLTPIEAPAMVPAEGTAFVQEANSDPSSYVSAIDGPLETQASFVLNDDQFRGFAPGSWDPYSRMPSRESERLVSHSPDYINQKVDDAFGIGYRPFLFGMSAKQAGEFLKLKSPRWESMPAATEYDSSEVRYLWRYLNEVPELLPAAGGQFSSTSHIILMFERDKLFRVSFRFLNTPDVQDHRDLLQRFAKLNLIDLEGDRIAIQSNHVMVSATVAPVTVEEKGISQLDFIKAGSPSYNMQRELVSRTRHLTTENP